jgi:hypothetical protein
MRRWVISSALLANALASGMVLLVLLDRGGWGNAVDLSPVVAQIREAAVANGLITAEELDRMLALLDDPACAFASPTMFTAWGRHP